LLISIHPKYEKSPPMDRQRTGPLPKPTDTGTVTEPHGGGLAMCNDDIELILTSSPKKLWNVTGVGRITD